MASVVRRQDGRFEIRESVVTTRGPRSRTLAVAREVTDEVLDQASVRATRPFDRERVLERARLVGARVELDEASRIARELLGALSAGGEVAPILARLLLDALDAPTEMPDSVESVAEWVGVPDERRGQVLRDLLRTADRILGSRKRPPRPGPLVFPRIVSTR